MANQQLSTNTFGTAKWIVSATASDGTHTTIAAALTAASSGDTIFVRPGTYTENLTLKAGVNICAYDCDALTPNVTIVGKCTFTAAGTVSISGIRLQTNSDFCLAVTGSADSIVNLENCYVNASNNTAISYSSSSASSKITIKNSTMDLGTTGIAYWTSSGAGAINLNNVITSNTGASTTASSTSATQINIFFSFIAGALSTSSSGTYGIYNSFLSTSAINTTSLTTAGTGSSAVQQCNVASGTASCISVGTGTTVNCFNINLTSSNTNCITGAGTITYAGLVFANSKIINTTTKSPEFFRPGLLLDSTGSSGTTNQIPSATTGSEFTWTATPQLTALGIGAAAGASGVTFDGTNLLNAYASSSWTPAIAFGGSSTGITYSAQAGQYTRIGNVVIASFSINLTSKGAQTGNATITGLPFTSGSSAGQFICIVACGALTFTTNYTYAMARGVASTTTLGLVQSGSGQSYVTITNTNFADTTFIAGTTVYNLN